MYSVPTCMLFSSPLRNESILITPSVKLGLSASDLNTSSAPDNISLSRSYNSQRMVI